MRYPPMALLPLRHSPGFGIISGYNCALMAPRPPRNRHPATLPAIATLPTITQHQVQLISNSCISRTAWSLTNPRALACPVSVNCLQHINYWDTSQHSKLPAAPLRHKPYHMHVFRRLFSRSITPETMADAKTTAENLIANNKVGTYSYSW
jgi:hypothetical protein